MAILPLFPNITVRIGIGGIFVKEYLDQGQDEVREARERASVPEHVRHRTIANYIESVTNAQFDIILSVKRTITTFDNCQSLGFEVVVDGKHIETAMCLPHHFVNGSWDYTILGETTPSAETGFLALRRFKFSELKLVDDFEAARVREDTKRVLDIGSIVVKVHRMGQGNEQALTPTQSRFADSLNAGTVSEKALKGQVLSHAVVFDPQEQINCSRTSYSAVPIYGWDNPMAVFRFRYRSKETLRSLSIVPRAETRPESTKRPYHSLAIPDRPPQGASAPPFFTTNLDTLDVLSLEQLVKLAGEQLNETKISDLTLVELERLVIAQNPKIDVSNFTVKELKDIAQHRIRQKQARIADLPYRELKSLASERLKARMAETKSVMSTPHTDQLTNSTPNINLRRSSALNTAEGEMSTTSQPNARPPLVSKTAAATPRSAASSSSPSVHGIERFFPTAAPCDTPTNSVQQDLPKLENSMTPHVKNESNEKTSVSSFLKSIRGNSGSKRILEDDPVPQKPDRPYKITKKRNGVIMVDLTGDD